MELTLKKYRKFKDYSQLDLNIDNNTYGRIERKDSDPRISTIKKICEALEISIEELFITSLLESNNQNDIFEISNKYSKVIAATLKNEVSVHINRDVVKKGGESIRYSGYVASMLFHNFELKIFAEGNVKCDLYVQGTHINMFKDCDIYDEIEANMPVTYNLKDWIVYEDYTEQKLKKLNGNALFVYESNSFIGILIDNNNNNVLNDDILFDQDDLFEIIIDYNMFFDYIWS